VRQRKPNGRQNGRSSVWRPEIHDHPYERHEHKAPVQKLLGYSGRAGKRRIYKRFHRGPGHDLFGNGEQPAAIAFRNSRDSAQSNYLVYAKESRQSEAGPGDLPWMARCNPQFFRAYGSCRGSPGHDRHDEPLEKNRGSVEGQAISGTQFRLAEEPLHSSVAAPGNDHAEKDENEDKVPRNKKRIHGGKWKHVFAVQRKKGNELPGQSDCEK